MHPSHLIFYYSEIALKGANRSMFEKKLLENIHAALSYNFPELVSGSSREYGRIVFSINETDDDARKKISTTLSCIPGIASFSFAISTEKDIASMTSIALELAKSSLFETFRINTRRSDKNFPITSPDVDKNIGAAICEKMQKKVLLKNPELTIWVDIAEKHAFVYTHKFIGVGGLPVGTGGKAALLLSGGIDSPIAGFYLAKRGVELCAVHFHASPYTSRASIDKARDLAQELSRFVGPIKLFIVPLADIQVTISKHCPENLRVLLYRRFMLRMANKIANDEHAQALITGESLGQVASQTIENMRVTEDVSGLPIFRPLIGFDKEEIIRKAKDIGTLDISLRPHEDCCTLFVPKHPKTKAHIADLDSAEQTLDIDKLVSDALSELSVETISPRKVLKNKAEKRIVL